MKQVARYKTCEMDVYVPSVMVQNKFQSMAYKLLEREL